MMNFCTLFDHNFMSRGLVLYSSLKEQCKDEFSLYVLATDDIAFEWLKNNSNEYERLFVYSLNDIKRVYPILQKIQNERTRAEFSWTLSSFSIQFFLKTFNLEDITYLDADMFFFNNPKIIFDEIDSTKSVIITPHNYTPCYDQSETSGRYCVQFMYFKNNLDGNMVLEWWRNECEKCCCSVPIDGKFGDQKYLDDWLSRFPDIVYESKSLGIGVAPWNIQQFNITHKTERLYIQNKITKLEYPVVFYHFHGVREYVDSQNQKWWDFNFSYDLSNDVQDIIYKPYVKKLSELSKCLPKQNLQIIQDDRINYFFVIKKTLKDIFKNLIKSFNLVYFFKRNIMKSDRKLIKGELLE